MAQFATTDELGARLGETLIGTRLAQATAALQDASAIIQNWTRRRLERVLNDAVVLHGVWGRYLELPERPVIDATVTAVDGSAPLADSYWLLGPALVRDGGWGGPETVVEVTYTHGYDPIPDDIRVATLQMAARMMANPQGVRTEGIGTYNVAYGPVSGETSPLENLSRYRIRAASVPIL